jgi:hypothetical protein
VNIPYTYNSTKETKGRVPDNLNFGTRRLLGKSTIGWTPWVETAEVSHSFNSTPSLLPSQIKRTIVITTQPEFNSGKSVSSMASASNKHSSHDRFAYASKMEPEPASFDRFDEKNENRVSFTKFLEKKFRRCPVPTIRNGAIYENCSQ